MPVTKDLFELQELDNDIGSTRQTLGLKTGQMGNRDALDKAAGVLAAEQKTLDELKHRRRDAEGDVADVTSKMSEANSQLYGGRITNPKELSSLQHEVNTLSVQKDNLETKALEIIDEMEEQEKKVAALAADYKKLESDWAREQQQLAADIQLLKKTLAGLEESRRELASRIEPAVLSLYEKIRLQKKQAVARVEQGICRACRISLSASVLQKARSGQPVQCGTCGRILFIS